ncbi:DUF926-domain-containing protein [Moesziomyces antarcticus]|uniref:DUF926-domain-containing protein n=2 Tax=Pseudozyma antarctica TaxID=84753 RepID=A0A081CLX7_PSEA2|nr:DUF926-domain-containing protein [Moesziomyces antarcticus]GAK67673.1 DUF926-domain-containing protein [Moesziomyces antarcticus]SPO49095.1 related to UPF0396 protein UM04995 [Moesziomyces antarcticus]
MPSLAERLGAGTAESSSADAPAADTHDSLDREQQLRARLLASKRAPRPANDDRGDDTRDDPYQRNSRARSRSRSSSPLQHDRRDRSSRSPVRQRRASPSYDAEPSTSSMPPPPPRPFTHPERRAPRPQADRWVPPPRPDGGSARGRDDRDRSDSRNGGGWGGSRGGRYFDADSDDRQGGDRSGSSEYGAAQWKRLPRDPYASAGSHSNGGGDGGFFASRNEQRKNSNVSIWPPSPPHPTLESDEEREERKRKRKHESSSRRHRDSDRDRHRSEGKRSDRHSSSRSHRHHSERDRHRSSRSSRSCRDDRDSDRHARSKRSSRASSASESGSESDASRTHRRHSKRRDSDRRHRSHRRSRSASAAGHSDSAPHAGGTSDRRGSVSSASSEEVGPTLPSTGADGKPIDPRAYGGALLPGEGSAMASFVQDGKRIPRRGEIGLSSDQIEAYEKAGYVMSGSRHHRMNAVRMRKENQVISAEEKRSMLRLQAEEKAKKEREIVSQFKELVDTLQPGTE